MEGGANARHGARGGPTCVAVVESEWVFAQRRSLRATVFTYNMLANGPRCVPQQTQIRTGGHRKYDGRTRGLVANSAAVYCVLTRRRSTARTRTGSGAALPG
jgi:hypothetical protein